MHFAFILERWQKEKQPFSFTVEEWPLLSLLVLAGHTVCIFILNPLTSLSNA